MPQKSQFDTPKRAKVQGALKFIKAKELAVSNDEVFIFFEVPRITGYRLIDEPSRTRHNQDLIETRGRKSKTTGAQTAEADKILQESEVELEGKRLI